MTRVLVVDDHHLVRQGIIALLEKTGEVLVVGEAADGYEAIEKIMELKPEVVIMDLAMPNLNGVQTIERINQLNISTKVVLLSMYSDPATVRQVLKFGVKGYLLKSSVTEELLIAIKAAKLNSTYLSPSIAEMLTDLSEIKEEAEDGLLLTPREKEVLELIAEGHTNNAIGYILNISSKTVEKHRASIMSKLQVHDIASLVRTAIKKGLIA